MKDITSFFSCSLNSGKLYMEDSRQRSKVKIKMCRCANVQMCGWGKVHGLSPRSTDDSCLPTINQYYYYHKYYQYHQCTNLPFLHHFSDLFCFHVGVAHGG